MGLAGMPHPFAAMPSLKQFVDNAIRQGCREGVSSPIHGPRGEVRSRYLVGHGPSGAVAILPNIDDDERLTPGKLSYLARVLKVGGYEHCLVDFEDNQPLS